jgi:hypothetical protein
MTTPTVHFGLFTDDGLDQTCYTRKEVKQEAKDLKAMGCNVKVLEVHGVDAEDLLTALDNWSRFNGRMVSKKAIVAATAMFPDCHVIM